MSDADVVRQRLWEHDANWARLGKPTPPMRLTERERRSLLMDWVPTTDGFHNPMQEIDGSYRWRDVPYYVVRQADALD